MTYIITLYKAAFIELRSNRSFRRTCALAVIATAPIAFALGYAVADLLK